MRVTRRIGVFTGLFIWGFLALTGCHSVGDAEPVYHSQYVGQEQRSIKSLSDQDIEELQTGKGWGLAKAAELNGVPGPSHLLEMAEEIHLTPIQRQQIEQLYTAMTDRAIPLGQQLVALEQELNTAFAERSMTDEHLQDLLRAIADVYQQLRYVHLSAHLKTPEILTSEQIASYNALRGYSSADPCNNIPVGHDADMWKLHNNCP